ncbi:MAG TPA: sigma 54-interacting transcriptional regulator [Candidatus Saccharimonadales bacterium]|nr:sigma 54-interacting transcriptional regulator [Candidatus Saccharimonadales bacterium]
MIPSRGESNPPELSEGMSADPETFYRAVLESLFEAVLITDAARRIRYASRRIADITGYEPAELVGRTVSEVFLPEGHGRRAACGANGADDSEPQCLEVEVRRKDGGLHWVYLQTTPYRNEHGETVGTVAAMSCIKQRKDLELANELLRDDLRRNFGNIVGNSPALGKVLGQIATVAPTEANVLILGESGTGKELVAQAIHDLGARKERSLVRVNCASIPKDLFESEFFGHVRGAFTGAVRDRVGRFELANGGTLFLDEVGEIPLDLQSKLLRVLQEGQFERLGDDRTRTVAVRVIAATNRDLLAEAEAGRFRVDLYYRLSVFPIELPPLRARAEDIAPLAAHFLAQSARRLGVPTPSLAPFHVRDLQGYDWPGNVRELQNVIERAVILSRQGPLQFDLPRREVSRLPVARPRALPAEDAPPGELSLDELIVREREIIVSALQRCHGKIYGTDGAAALLNIKPTTLVSKMKRLKVDNGKSPARE